MKKLYLIVCCAVFMLSAAAVLTYGASTPANANEVVEEEACIDSDGDEEGWQDFDGADGEDIFGWQLDGWEVVTEGDSFLVGNYEAVILTEGETTQVAFMQARQQKQKGKKRKKIANCRLKANQPAGNPLRCNYTCTPTGPGAAYNYDTCAVGGQCADELDLFSN